MVGRFRVLINPLLLGSWHKHSCSRTNSPRSTGDTPEGSELELPDGSVRPQLPGSAQLIVYVWRTWLAPCLNAWVREFLWFGCVIDTVTGQCVFQGEIRKDCLCLESERFVLSLKRVSNHKDTWMTSQVFRGRLIMTFLGLKSKGLKQETVCDLYDQREQEVLC